MIKVRRVMAGIVVAVMLVSVVAVARGAQVVGDAISVSGVLKVVRMTNFPDNPWTEMVLETEAGEQYVLIGEKAGPLHGNAGKNVDIEGVLKPAMSVRGRPTPAIEIGNVQIDSGS